MKKVCASPEECRTNRADIRANFEATAPADPSGSCLARAAPGRRSSVRPSSLTRPGPAAGPPRPSSVAFRRGVA